MYFYVFPQLGQFWNVPVTVEYFNVSRDGYPLFIVSVAYPDAPVRSSIAELLDWDWEGTAFSCLYAGNGNAGPLLNTREKMMELLWETTWTILYHLCLITPVLHMPQETCLSITHTNT